MKESGFIVVENLHKSFGDQKVLDGANLTVKKGEIVALIGPSGQGKSVLIKHIVGLLKPDEGSVYIDQLEISRMSGKTLTRMMRRFGYLFQSGALLDSMNLFDNVALPLREVLHLPEKEIHEKVMDELEKVGLKDHFRKNPSQLSGGMVKRASLARALIMNPDIILFDEATTGLDPMIARAILYHIRERHNKLKFTGILVTHQIPLAFEIEQKVAMIYNGKVVYIDNVENTQKCENPFVCQFIKGRLEGPITEIY
jgi:phospholipid/cholesterol/gamma-HCH transport system ATP-binding protein